MKTTFIIILFFTIIFGCKEEPPEPVVIDFRSVTVSWKGNPHLDGCGFFCKIDEIEYKPNNEEFFGTEFKILRDTIVEMKYRDLKRDISYSYGDSYPFPVKGIEVLDIK